MKYIYIDGIGFVIFSATVSHDTIAMIFDREVVSAGFVRCHDTSFIGCSGDSLTLKKKAGMFDTEMLRAELR